MIQYQYKNNPKILSKFLVERRYEIVKKNLEVKKNSLVLDIGCRTGNFQGFCKLKDKQYIGIDLRKFWPDDKKNLYLGDVSKKMPKEVNSKKYDYIVIIALIEHLKNPDKFISKVKKLLKKDGEIIITTPHPSGEVFHNFGAKIGLFSKNASEEHENLLDENDFKVIAEKNSLVIKKYQKFLFGFNQLIIFRNDK